MDAELYAQRTAHRRFVLTVRPLRRLVAVRKHRQRARPLDSLVCFWSSGQTGHHHRAPNETAVYSSRPLLPQTAKNGRCRRQARDVPPIPHAGPLPRSQGVCASRFLPPPSRNLSKGHCSNPTSASSPGPLAASTTFQFRRSRRPARRPPLVDTPSHAGETDTHTPYE